MSQSGFPLGGPVTLWIEQLKDGDTLAIEELWSCYFVQLVQLAKRKLEGSPRAAADEEDVALSAFNSFCLGARLGQFPKLTDRDSLWSLLVGITAHKCIDQIRYEHRKKRRIVSAPMSQGDDRLISQIISKQPTPEFAALMAEQFELLLKRLEEADDPDLIQIAIARMLGDSTTEIATQLGCVRRTVERKLSLIRRTWEQDC